MRPFRYLKTIKQLTVQLGNCQKFCFDERTVCVCVRQCHKAKIHFRIL